MIDTLRLMDDVHVYDADASHPSSSPTPGYVPYKLESLKGVSKITLMISVLEI